MRAKEFITEAEIRPYRSKALTIAQVVKELRKYCSESISMVHEPLKIWRGMQDDRASVLRIDTSVGKRKSENTSNHYTELMDHSPLYAGWPKRSKSLICTTDVNYAADFGTPYAIFPYNGMKIAVCPTYDLWQLRVDSAGFHSYENLTPNQLNRYLNNMLDLPDSYTGMLARVKKSDYPSILDRKGISLLPEQLIPALQQALSPNSLGLRLVPVAEFVSTIPSRKEVWMSGKVIAIRYDILESVEFRDAFNKSPQ